MTPRAPRRRTVIGIASGASLALLAIAGAAAASSHHTATMIVDGVQRPFSGFSQTVGQALAESGIPVGPHDAVSPALSADLRDGANVTVRRAQPYSVATGGKVARVWSTGDSVQAVAQDIAASGRTVIVPVSRDAQRQALPTLGGAGTLTVLVDGRRIPVRVDASETAAQTLAAAHVDARPNDRVYARRTPEGVELHVDRVSRGYAQETKRLGFPTQKRSDPTLAQGSTRVVREGRAGAEVTRYFRETLNGDVTFKARVGRETRRPVARILAVGAKKPAPAPSASEPTPATKSSSANAGASRPSAAPAPKRAATSGSGQGSAPAGAWGRLAQCESGGNPAANTGNGFYGLYQFDAGTWHAMGGSGLPSEASAAEQTRIAQKLQAQSGWGPWPGCSARLGLG